jgi:hypothetical protein
MDLLIQQPPVSNMVGAPLSLVMSSPDFYPVRADMVRRIISFAYLTRKDYRNWSFLDDRELNNIQERYVANIDDICFYDANVSAHSGIMHYVLHPAFACSTLLTRYLDLIPSCLTVREPSLLTQLASTRPRHPTAHGPDFDTATNDWMRLLKIVLKLLARRYVSSDIVIVKPHDACNSLGEYLLEHDSGSKIVFLSIDLRTFLLSVLKAKQRRIWLRARIENATKDASAREQLQDVDHKNLTDAQAGAYLWLLNSTLCKRVKRAEPGRVLVISGAAVAESPRITLQTVINFLGLAFGDGQLNTILDDPSISTHSKDMSRAFDPTARERDLTKAEETFGTEVNRGLEWCQKIGHDVHSDWGLG